MADKYLLAQVAPVLGAPLYIYSADGKLKEKIPGNSAGSENGLCNIIEKTTQDFPYIETDNEGITVCSMWDKTQEEYIVTGRVCLYGYYKKDGIYIPYCPKEQYTSAILILWKNISGENIGRNELWQKNLLLDRDIIRLLTKNIFQFQEEAVLHNFYPQELMELECIRNGDTEGLKQSIDNAVITEICHTSAGSVRNWKNTAVYIINAAARSAVEGGLSHDMAFVMCGTFISNIEENLSTQVKIEQAIREAEFAFAREVHNINSKGSSKNPLIAQVKDYIFGHIHDNIIISDVARHVGVSPNYLSEQFKVSEGMPLKQYIINEKIRNSEYLLKYTEYSLQEISSVCAFSSQSRFSDYFKRKNGITPSKYRKKYKKG
ncbi:MAG: AraC family transcriptional regulator [Lachnospiraceae bacterium]